MAVRREAVALRAMTAPKSFDEFFNDEHDGLYRALYFVTGNRQDAEDLMQEAFLRLWERWDRIDQIDDPTSYLFRVALNGFRMQLRRAKTAARRLIGIGDASDPTSDVELRADLHRLLLGVSPRQRAALVLLDLYGYTSEEAGRILGIRAPTIRALASQGRAALRKTHGDRDV